MTELTPNVGATRRRLIGAAVRTLGGRIHGPRSISWAGAIQPVPLHRARVVLTVRSRGRARTHLPDSDYEFRDELRRLWMADRLHRRLTGELAVVMTFAGCSVVRDAIGRRRARTRPDLTNLAKAVEDAGNEVLWVDDSQIQVLFAEVAAWGEHVAPLITLDAWELGSREEVA